MLVIYFICLYIFTSDSRLQEVTHRNRPVDDETELGGFLYCITYASKNVNLHCIIQLMNLLNNMRQRFSDSFCGHRHRFRRLVAESMCPGKRSVTATNFERYVNKIYLIPYSVWMWISFALRHRKLDLLSLFVLSLHDINNRTSEEHQWQLQTKQILESHL